MIKDSEGRKFQGVSTIKKKDDCIILLGEIVEDGYDDYTYGRFFEFNNPTYGWQGKTRIGFNGEWYILNYNKNKSWCDDFKVITYEELLKYVWNNRKYINRSLE